MTNADTDTSTAPADIAPAFDIDAVRIYDDQDGRRTEWLGIDGWWFAAKVVEVDVEEVYLKVTSADATWLLPRETNVLALLHEGLEQAPATFNTY